MIVQWGDYREAVRNFARGGVETYAAQRYSVDYVASLTRTMAVSVICLPAAVHDEMLPNGVRSIGVSRPNRGHCELLKKLEQVGPTDLVVFAPDILALTWGLVRRKRVLPLFADSFQARSIRQRARNRVLARLLSSPLITIVANHNIPASLDLVRIGVNAEKIVPWDWPQQNTPYMNEPKLAPSCARSVSLFYVGSLTESKGVGDAIRAVRLLKDAGIAAQLSLAGSGREIEALRTLAVRERVADIVRFLGRIPNSEVVSRMHEHDLVLVPSRHEYPEGLPMTIYEGFCSRSPLVVSDHPMFSRQLKHRRNAMVFKAADPTSLAGAVREILAEPALYSELSCTATLSWEAIQCPVKYADLLDRWLRGSEEDHAYFAAHSIAGRGL